MPDILPGKQFTDIFGGFRLFIIKARSSIQLETLYQRGKKSCSLFGIDVEVTDKNSESNVKSMFLKEDSIAKFINLQYDKNSNKSIKIKFEIDVNPP